MAYNEFSLDRVRRDFSLVVKDNIDLSGHVREIPVSPSLRSVLDECVPLAIGIGNEKARSELIIAAILVEVRRLTGRRIGFFTGVELNVASESRPDRILRLHPVALASAGDPHRTDHDDRGGEERGHEGRARPVRGGDGGGADLQRTRGGRADDDPRGRHDGDELAIPQAGIERPSVDSREYPLEPVGRILAILLHCVGVDPAAAGAAA